MKFETTVNSGDFKDAMENVKLALSKQPYRQEMQMIKMVFDKNRIELWSLDGYRIHTQALAGSGCSQERIELLTDYVKIPKSAILNIEIDMDEKTITYDAISQKITSRFTDVERFPKNLEKFKEEHQTNFKIGVDPKFLIDALQKYKKDSCVILDFNTNLNVFIVRKSGQQEDYNLILPVRLPESER
jgi:DNA polymerase III sliding clamp (beta) subunit (PCNA family)